MAAVDPDGQQIYLSEDQPDGLFYRYTPPAGTWGSGAALEGGTLEAMAVAADGAVTWLPVPDAGAPTAPLRASVPGATTFDGGEGVVFDSGRVYLTTKSDDRVWVHDIAAQTMAVLYDAAEFADARARRRRQHHRLGGPRPLRRRGRRQPRGQHHHARPRRRSRRAHDRARSTASRPGTPIPTASEVTGLALSPDGNRLYFNSERGQRLRDPLRGARARSGAARSPPPASRRRRRRPLAPVTTAAPPATTPSPTGAARSRRTGGESAAPVGRGAAAAAWSPRAESVVVDGRDPTPRADSG